MTRLHRSGARPHRLLVLGGRAQLGLEAVTGGEPLGERIADRVWLRTRRGVDLDMVWELRPVLQAMNDGASDWRLWRYDAVVLLAPAPGAGLLTRWRSRGVGALLRRVAAAVAPSCYVLIVAQSPASFKGRHRAAVDSVADAGGPVERVSTLVTNGDHGAAADAVAQRLLPSLDAADAVSAGTVMDLAHRRRGLPNEEPARQAALDELALRNRAVSRRLQQVVDLARETFESASAELTLIDRDERWIMAVSGRPSQDRSRQSSLCNQAIQQRDPTVIADAWAVPTLRGDALGAAVDPVRFYAAYPIESIAGYRIGVLCVWDDTPHDVDQLDVAALRDLALLAEAELISADRDTH